MGRFADIRGFITWDPRIVRAVPGKLSSGNTTMSAGQPDRAAVQAAKSKPLTTHSHSAHAGLCIQEWTGAEWIVIEAMNCASGYTCQPLSVEQMQGQFLGHRVITPAVAGDPSGLQTP